MNNDKAWEIIFNSIPIEEEIRLHSLFTITSQQINEIGRREARLMAKFDTKESLPKIFKELELNINATSNGKYIIFKDKEHKSFIKLPDYNNLKRERFIPNLDYDLDTLVFNNRLSESNAIDYAHHANLLSKYSGEQELKLTTRGRFYSNDFYFNIGTIGTFNIKGVQIEVDAGYEGNKQFLIIEAKASTRLSFNIRQLYYPYKHFQNKTGKQIKTILLSFSNGVYYFTELGFSENYYDYKIIHNKAYEIIIGEAKKTSIRELLKINSSTPAITVPQADDLNKVIDLVSFLSIKPANKFDIAEHFEFHDRQGDYYANAACYIGLVEKQGVFFQPTKNGNELITLNNRDERNIFILKSILNTSLFNDLFRILIEQGYRIGNEQIVARISQENLSGTTPARRKSTVKAWLNWMLTVLIENKIE